MEFVQLDVVAGGLGGLGEEIAEFVGDVDLHFLWEFVAEEGDEEEVELLGLGEVVDAGVAEADGFAFGVGEDGDVGFGVEADAEAGAFEAGAELGVGVDVDDDAVVYEGDLGLVGVDVAGGFGVAADVEAALGAVEELLVERALEGLGGDFDLDGAGSGGGEAEEAEGEEDVGNFAISGL